MNPPKIFISATSGDLGRARQIAKEALLTINCHPVEQTNFEPDWRSVTDMLRGKISDCQALIHLVGFRYGAEPAPASLPPGTQRRSYTQMEYHLARELGLRVYTFLLPETYPFDVPAKADTPEQTQLQAAHRTLIQSSPHLCEKPANDLDLRTRIIALQEKSISLEQEQQSIAKEVKSTRHWGLWAAAVIILILGGIGVWQWHGQSQLASQVQIVSQKQDEQTNLLKDQSNLLREAVVQLEQLTEEKSRLGIKITDLPREVLEKELAARVEVSAVDLRLNIEAGKKSQDALTRAHANLLAGQLADAHNAAKEVRDAEAPAIQRIIQSLQVDGQAYFQEGKYESALESYQKAAALVDKAFDHIAWAEAQGWVTFIQLKLARYNDAEPLMREILQLREQHLVPTHFKIGTTLNNLALLLRETNRLTEAEQLMQRALKIHEASLGLEHPDVAKDLTNLGLMLKEMNRPGEAELLMRRALKIFEVCSGNEHPNTATALNNLAQLLQDTNRPTEAEPLMQKALKIDEASLGSNNPDVARDLNNLAHLLQATNRLGEAEPLMLRALKIDEVSLGSNHPAVATALNNLAELFRATKRFTEAEPLIRRALKIDEANFSPDHPRVAVRLNNLALVLEATNRLTEAEPLFRRALTIDEASLVSNNPDVARDLHNLAHLLKATNRPTEAEPLMQRALKIDESNFGPDHPRVAIDLNNLAMVLKATNRLTEAEPLMQRALKIDETTFGPNHPDVAIELNNLAQLLQAANRLTEAEPLGRRAVGIVAAYGRSTGNEHPELRTLLSNYYKILIDLKLPEDEIKTKLLGAVAPDLGPFKVIITQVVEGGQGETLGLQSGDIYLTYNGQAITSMEQFIQLVGEAKGEAIPLEVLRDGKKLNFTAKPGKFGTMIENRPISPTTGAPPAK